MLYPLIHLLLAVTLIDIYKIPKSLLAAMVILEHIIKEVWVKVCRKKKSLDFFFPKIMLIIAITNSRERCEQIEFLF